MKSMNWSGMLYLDHVPVCTARRILADAERVGEWGSEHLVSFHDYIRNDVMFRLYFPDEHEDPEHVLRMIVEEGQFKKVCALAPEYHDPDPLHGLAKDIPVWKAELDLDTNEIEYDIPERIRW